MHFECREYDLDTGDTIPNTGCGVVPYITFDGYNFGDRMLEGVMFKAWVNDNDEIEVSSVEDWNQSPYLRKLNQAHWYAAALNYITRVGSYATCPHCHGDVMAELIP